MRLGSLFAGIGGFDLAASRCGIEIGWQVEIDEWCREVLAKHWPDVPKFGDIHDIQDGDLEHVDIIAGGFPCQPVSLAGRGLAQEDPRWLWPEFERIIRMVRPRYVVMENVPGLLQRGMGDVLGGLSACGYDAEWESVRATSFGAPHRRERIFIVAYPNSSNGAAGLGNQPHGTPQIFRKYPEERDELWVQTPDFADRMDDGVSRKLYRPRVKALGNTIVPQVAEWIFQQIVKRERLSI